MNSILLLNSIKGVSPREIAQADIIGIKKEGKIVEIIKDRRDGLKKNVTLEAFFKLFGA